MTDNMGLVPMSAELTMFYHDFTASLALAAQQERDRIIKMLEKHTHPEAEAEYLIDCNLCERYYGIGLALALIKGEQK